METQLLTLIIIVLALAVGVQLLCDRLRVPAIVGFLATGLLAGPSGLGLVPEGNETLADIGVVLLLFTIGVEFSFRKLSEMRRYVLIGGAFQVLATIAVWAGLVSLLTTHSSGQAVFLGYLVAMSSTAIMFRLLQERSELESPHGRLAIGISIFQDLASIIMMLSIPLLAGQGGSLAGALLRIGWQGAAILGMVYLMARYLVPALLNRIARTRSRELFLLATLLICLGIPWLTTEIGLSVGIGAFLAGLIIAETQYSHQALAGVMPFKDVFSAVFFISIGVLLDVKVLGRTPLMIVAITCGMMGLKLLINGGAGLLLGFPLRTALLCGLLLCNTGEFTFVLAALGHEQKLISNDVYQMCIAVTVLSMAATPLLMRLAPRLTAAATRLPLPARLHEGGETEQPVPSEKLSGHIVIVGFGVIGRNVARAAEAAGVGVFVIEMNHETARREREAGMSIIGGDATQEPILERACLGTAALLVVAVPDPQETRQITQVAHRLAPQVPIIARTRFAGQIEELGRLGASHVVPDEFEAAVAMVALALQRLYIPEKEIARSVEQLRAGAYDLLRRPTGGALLRDLEQDHGDIEVASVRLGGESVLVGRTLAEIDLRRRHQVTLLAIRRGGQVIANPGGDEPLGAGDILILFGPAENVARLGDAVV